jgi:hypothetical protein
MLSEALREFVAVTGVAGKASNPRLKELMVTLRRAGLTSPNVVALSGGKLSATIVRQYTRGWGGVDESLAKELDVLVGPLRELVLSGRGVGDVETVLALDRSVKAKESTLEEVAELNMSFKNCDMSPGEVGEMLTLMRGLKDQGFTPAAVKIWKKIDDELKEIGFNKLIRALLLDASETYGNIYNALTAIREHKSLVEIRRLKNVEDAGLKEAQSRRLEEEAAFNRHKEANTSLAFIYAFGWNPTALQWAPEVLKRADTPQKRATLCKHFNQLEWHDIGEGEMRIVKSDKAVFHDPVVMAKTFQELRSACNRSVPFDIDQLLNFTSLMMEKLPGLTISDYVHVLLKLPGVSEHDKEVAKYLLSLEAEAKEAAPPDEYGVNGDVLKFQYYLYQRMIEELKKRNPTPEQQEAYEQIVQLETNTIPPGADLRAIGKKMIVMMDNLAEAEAKDKALSEDEKIVLSSLRDYLGLLEEVRLKEDEKDLRFGEPTGGARIFGDKNNTPQTSTRRVDYNLLKRIDRETRDKIIPRIFLYPEPPYELIEEISEELDMNSAAVETLINYFMTDPASRDELRERYTNSALPGWVVVIPGDKFASSTRSEKTE